jgi:hypothetical protein
VQYIAKVQAKASQLFHLASCLFRFVQHHDPLPPVTGMLAQLIETRRLLNCIHPAKSLTKKLDKAQVKFAFKDFEKLGLFYNKLSDDDIKQYSKVPFVCFFFFLLFLPSFSSSDFGGSTYLNRLGCD